ncbi:MAG: nucleotidyltransferase family protein [Armatimonadota bacterium]
MIKRTVIAKEKIPVSTAAKVLNSSRVHVYNLLDRGELAYERYGPQTTLVSRDSVINLLRRRGAAVEVDGDELVILEAKVPLDPERIRDFCRRWQITSFALFGSVLRKDFRPDSDVDVLVAFAPDARITLFDLAQMQEELEAMFSRQVDLVDRRSIEESHNQIRRTEILTTAEEVYHAAA